MKCLQDMLASFPHNSAVMAKMPKSSLYHGNAICIPCSGNPWTVPLRQAQRLRACWDPQVADDDAPYLVRNGRN